MIDAFYKRWGSHNGFQRTRGVLRLLASIVGDLWQRRSTETQSQALIQPAHLNFTVDALKSSLTRLWGASYESVIAADVIGKTSNSVQFEKSEGLLERKDWQGLPPPSCLVLLALKVIESVKHAEFKIKHREAWFELDYTMGLCSNWKTVHFTCVPTAEISEKRSGLITRLHW